MGKIGMAAVVAVLLLASVAFAGAVGTKGAASAPDKPDLVVGGMTVRYVPDGWVELCYNTWNIGSARDWAVWWDGFSFANEHLYPTFGNNGPLPQGSVISACIATPREVVCPRGIKLSPITVVIDLYNLVDEKNEANNAKTVYYDCGSKPA